MCCNTLSAASLLPLQLAGWPRVSWLARSVRPVWQVVDSSAEENGKAGTGGGSSRRQLENGPAVPGIVELGPTAEEGLAGELGAGRALGWQSGCIHYWVYNGLLWSWTKGIEKYQYIWERGGCPNASSGFITINILGDGQHFGFCLQKALLRMRIHTTLGILEAVYD